MSNDWTRGVLLVSTTFLCCVTARAETLTPPAPEASPPPGSLLIVGGGVTPPEIFEAFFRLAGDADARLVHVPTATAKFDTLPDKYGYYAEWTQRPKKSFHFVHARSREEAEAPDLCDPLREASGVWLGGGDQARLARIYYETPMVEALLDVVRRGGVVAGTSSGASIMSQMMIGDDAGLGPDLAGGFNLCPRTIIDCHLSERNRVPRMLRLIEQFPFFSGIGIDEKTALLVQGSRGSVLGQGGVSFFARDGATGVVRRIVIRSGQSCELVNLQPASATVESLAQAP